MPNKHVKRALTALVVTLLLAAGCSSDSGDSGDSGDQGPLWTGPAPNTDPMSEADAAAIDAAATDALE